MELEQWMIDDGLKYIVGTWQVDFLVNAFSNDLTHIPATEFKSADGSDFTAVTFEFFEDHTMVMKDTSKGKEEKGTWEQTGMTEFHYTLNAFFDIPDNSFLKAAETLLMQNGNLAFSIGFLAVSMKKIKDGVITREKKPDIGEIEMSAEDAAMKEIVGKYRIYKSMGVVSGKFDLFTKDEIQEEMSKKLAAGEIDEDDAQGAARMFDMIVEFTDGHEIVTWMKMPADLSEEQIKAALDSGEIFEIKDGLAAVEKKAWKALDGKYYYDSGEHAEIDGEVQSPWKELERDDEGMLKYASGMMVLKKCE